MKIKKLNNYFLYFNRSNITKHIYTYSILAAKKEATKRLVFGCGDVFILDENKNPICKRRFWNKLGKYGWHKWEDIY